MYSDQAIDPGNNECIFYFKYQMKLEFIPFIEQQIRQFLQICSSKVHQPHQRDPIMRVLNKRVQQIDKFYQKYWNDYRMQQVLTSRKLLLDFLKQHHALLCIPKERNARDQTRQSISVLMTEKDRSVSIGRDKENGREYKIVDQPLFSKFDNKNNSSDSKRSPAQGHVSFPQSLQTTPANLKVPHKNSPKAPAASNDTKRIISRQKQPIKVKTKSAKVLTKGSPTAARKMTKEEYIAHLRNKRK